MNHISLLLHRSVITLQPDKVFDILIHLFFVGLYQISTGLTALRAGFRVSGITATLLRADLARARGAHRTPAAWPLPARIPSHSLAVTRPFCVYFPVSVPISSTSTSGAARTSTTAVHWFSIDSIGTHSCALYCSLSCALYFALVPRDRPSLGPVAHVQFGRGSRVRGRARERLVRLARRPHALRGWARARHPRAPARRPRAHLFPAARLSGRHCRLVPFVGLASSWMLIELCLLFRTSTWF